MECPHFAARLLVTHDRAGCVLHVENVPTLSVGEVGQHLGHRIGTHPDGPGAVGLGQREEHLLHMRRGQCRRIQKVVRAILIHRHRNERLGGRGGRGGVGRFEAGRLVDPVSVSIHLLVFEFGHLLTDLRVQPVAHIEGRAE